MSGRAYDALYDVSYTVSGARDHYRQQTMSGGFHVERAPVYGDMFSVLPHHPASSYRFKNRDKVPAFVDRTFHAEQPSLQAMATISQPDVVAGTERFKYFRRPMLAAPDPVIIKQGAVAPPPPVPPPVEVPRSRTVGTQSDYRENDTQTIPWEPDVVLPENPSVKQQALSAKYNCSGPELLTLKDLKFGEGLPPGLQEVRRIEKMREKRAFEASLPPLHDVEKLPIRQKMIEEWEKMEWEDREDEILGVQDERLALLEQALIAREGDVDDVTARRVEDRKTALLQERADKFASLQAGRIKTMRHLSEARKYVEKPRKLHKLSVIEKYADFGSSAYAPMQREGKVTQRQNIETEGFQPVSLQGLDELEAYLPSRLLNPIIGVPQKPLKLDYQQRKEAGIQNDLKSINDLLDTAKATKGRGIGEAWPAPLGKDAIGTTPAIGADLVALKQQQQIAEKKQQQQRATIRAADRPDTPILPPSVTPASAKEAAAVLLQRLLRGRAAQNAMHEGKMRRQALILELLQEIHASSGASGASSVSDAEDESMGFAFSALLSSLVSNDAAARANAARATFSAAAAAASSIPPAQPSKPAFIPNPPAGPKSGSSSSRPISATYAILGSIVDEIAAEVDGKGKGPSTEPATIPEEAEEAEVVVEAEEGAGAIAEAKPAVVEESKEVTEEPVATAETEEPVPLAETEEPVAAAETEELAKVEAELEIKDTTDETKEAEVAAAEETEPLAQAEPVATTEGEVEVAEAEAEAEADAASNAALPIADDGPTTDNEDKANAEAATEEAVAPPPEAEAVAVIAKEAEAESSPPDLTPDAAPADDEAASAEADEEVLVNEPAVAEESQGEGEGPSSLDHEEPILTAEPSIGAVLGAVKEDLMGEASFAAGLLAAEVEEEAETEEASEDPKTEEASENPKTELEASVPQEEKEAVAEGDTAEEQ